MMHIITGSARGVRLETLPGNHTRPTSERAKEAIFSMLQFDLQQRRVLDLFAGSGQMGLEALSRGAAHATLVDYHDKAVAILQKNAEKTRLSQKAEIVRADALSFLNSYRNLPYHLIFLDPPYARGLLAQALHCIAERSLATPGATIVAECGDPCELFEGDEALANRYEVIKTKRYGVAHVFFLVPKEEEL